MDNTELLEQLADIHLPEAVSFWPPAPGWWLLTLVLVSAVILLGRLTLLRLKQRKILEFALFELDKIHQQFENLQAATGNDINAARLQFINDFNAVLRRVALWHHPEQEIASLSGAAWVDFIREKGDSTLMTDELADALQQGRFKPHCEFNVAQLYQFGQKWITSLYQMRKDRTKLPRIRA